MSLLRKILYSTIIYYVIYYILFEILGASSSVYAILITLVPFAFVVLFLIVQNKREKQVKLNGKYYKELVEINQRFNNKFIKISKIKRTICEKEFSRKSYERSRADDILSYYIENNTQNLRNDILNAYRNKKIYDEYLKEFELLYNNINDDFSRNKKLKLEKNLIKLNKIDKNVYDLSVRVVVEYETPAGKNYYKKSRKVEYDELCSLYMKWRNGHKYEQTKKQERKFMNDQLRYAVLKRDNFKCQKCGVSANDGAKLHVDHIIPVSKGGKTTMSNLQTLCDRCNLGKSDKDN